MRQVWWRLEGDSELVEFDPIFCIGFVIGVVIGKIIGLKLWGR